MHTLRPFMTGFVARQKGLRPLSGCGPIMIAILPMFAGLASASSLGVVADVSEATGDTPPPGWSIFWNAPDVAENGTVDLASNPLGDLDAYEPMTWVKARSAYRVERAQRFAEADDQYVRYISASNRVCHTGPGGRDAGAQRYVIWAYTLQADDGTGVYGITDSRLTTLNDERRAGDTLEVRIWVDRFEIAEPRVFTGKIEAGRFNQPLGRLEPGQTIYVAVGPDGSAFRDKFDIDFAIRRLDNTEPSNLTR